MKLRLRVEWQQSGVSHLNVPAYLVRRALALVGPDEEPDIDTFESMPDYQEWKADHLTGNNLSDVVDEWFERDAPELIDTEMEGSIDQALLDEDAERRAAEGTP